MMLVLMLTLGIKLVHSPISNFQIFAGAFPENYEPPSGFYFEVNDDSPIVQVNILKNLPLLTNLILQVLFHNCITIRVINMAFLSCI